MKSLNFRLVLASESPRRRQLLKELGFDFRVLTTDFEEVFTPGIPPDQLALDLALGKALSIRNKLEEREVVLAADTIVALGNEVLGKPADENEAFEMLRLLSGKTHEVITGCSLVSADHETSFHDLTHVSFRELLDEEIRYYISNYKPFDKAGAYGIQEWIGMVGVSRLEGSYFNVVGLPLNMVYHHLLKFPA